MNLSVTFILLLSFLSLYDCNDAPQGCMDKQRVMGILRQMEKFLKGQEIRFTEGLRIMKSKLTNLQNSVSKFPQADQSLSQSSCPPLVAPANGRKFGSKYLLGHEVHFTCSQGFRLVGPVTRVCQENGTWSGATASCKAPPEWSVMNDPAFSRKPRCAKVDRAQHCSCDAGFHMSGTSDNSICQDVNECEVYKADRGGPLCVHACVNVPGSYHCSCPTGYKLLADGRSCEDVDECLTQQHNCSRGSTCINTGGGFQCVSPECPPAHANASYVKTSPLQCERNPCPMESRSCPLAAKTISYHYLSLPSNLRTPATLFRMATASAPGRPGPDSLRFGIASGGDSRSLFVMQRSDRQTGELILVQPLRGPQELSVEVEMSEYAERSFQAKHLARVTLLVSPYEF
ncbi:fibulin-7 isoform X2 [Danio rerio]|uniref:Fibulin-7 isoform X2 n=1 Tax=Danio rerio TaxID=7955 RepID=A0A8M3BEV9_DANRE|nr:fibulin-7 isoform X2 [Danio rerio]|eukprot:XP_009305867.1 fibulin-7 isoform X2 [Danio rerio]